MTKNEIIDRLFTMFENLSFQGVILEEENEELNKLFEEYCNIKREEGTLND